MVSQHGCIRVIKEAIALIDKGYIVDLIVNQLPYGYNFFSTTMVWNDRNQLQTTLKNSPADIFHVHNEPDWLVPATREVSGDRPVIYDVHDLESLRWHKQPMGEEIEAFAAADGIIHVSEPIRKLAESYHGAQLPTRVVLCMQPDGFVANDSDIIPNPSFKSLVYEGGLDANTKPKPIPGEKNKAEMNIRNFVNVFSHFRAQGFSVTIYPATPKQRMPYEMMGCYVGTPVLYPTMLSGLRPYGLGFVGCGFSTPLMELAMPNKLFEYMSQGVVPIVYNAEVCEKFVTHHKCGIVIEDITKLNELIEAHDMKEIRNNVLTLRKKFTMESQVHKLETLYKEVLESG